jgi:hypothetical protein
MKKAQLTTFRRQQNFDFIIDKIKIDYSHRELFMSYLKEQLEYFVHFNSQTRLRHMILELRHRDKTRMP